MKIIAGYELASGKEQCIGTWDTIESCAKSLMLTKNGVYSRLFRGKNISPRRSGKRKQKYYLIRVDISDTKEEENVS